jgi:hypothetical protein
VSVVDRERLRILRVDPDAALHPALHPGIRLRLGEVESERRAGLELLDLDELDPALWGLTARAGREKSAEGGQAD